MNFFLKKLLLPIVRRRLAKKLATEKEAIIKVVNEKVDLPKMDEEQEKEFFDKLYEAILVVVDVFL